MVSVARAGGLNITIDGAQTFQTIDGFGVNVNAHSWNQGELRPALDLLHDQMGATLYRVVYDMEDWEATNDNADPDNADWSYYNALYSNAGFQELWGTLHYLNQKGISTGITLSFMGRVPTWMGGQIIDVSLEDEWVETIATLVWYARTVEQVQFSLLDPLNEPDWDGIEGPQVNEVQYTRLLRKISAKLDALGMADIRLLGPSTASIDTGVNSYLPVMMTDPVVMSKLDHFAFHNYTGYTAEADAAIRGSSYATKDFWISEVTNPWDIMGHLAGHSSSVMVWDGYDSAYLHPTLRGESLAPPNDAGNGPAPLAYDTSTGAYTPRKSFYQLMQLFKFTPPGSLRISAVQSDSDLTVYAFYHEAGQRVTIIGQNKGPSDVAVAGSLSGLPALSHFQHYVTDPGFDFERLADIPISDSSFSFTALANSYFTLTSLAAIDTASPSVSITAPADGSTVAGTVTISAASEDSQFAAVQFLLDEDLFLGAEDTAPPFSVLWDTTQVANGAHTLTARAWDAAGNLSSTVPIAITVSNQVSTGLVAAYGFNEGAGTVAADDSGSNLAGNVVNATWSESGKYGSAISFNGVNSWVTINDAAALNLTTGLTLEAWIKPATLSGWSTIILKEAGSEEAYALYANEDRPWPLAAVRIDGNYDIATGDVQLPLNNWSHVASTYDGATLSLYVDGNKIASVAATGNLQVSSGALRIGGNAIWDEYFDGLIDEVRIYSRALTAAEIQTDMAMPIGVNRAEMQAAAQPEPRSEEQRVELWLGEFGLVALPGTDSQFSGLVVGNEFTPIAKQVLRNPPALLSRMLHKTRQPTRLEHDEHDPVLLRLKAGNRRLHTHASAVWASIDQLFGEWDYSATDLRYLDMRMWK
jgi:O-glycosyl hydrolase